MLEKMKQLKLTLNNASKHYYNGQSIMTDKEWDNLYNEYEKLEKQTRVVFSDSPTQNVGYEVISKLQKVKHESKMLSLDKTKDKDSLISFLGNKTGLLSWKLDGLTIVLTYNDGKLMSAVTRGNGDQGEDITHNAKCFANIPLKIDYKDKLIIRGEAVISKLQFEIINEIEGGKYKNPRNLTSGTIRQLDNKIVADRKVDFVAFIVISSSMITSKSIGLETLEELGFDVVGFEYVEKDNLIEKVEGFSKNIESYKYQVDGLVLTFDDISYSESLGSTGHHNKDSIAFKWTDEVSETTLLDIEWNTSRTGLINPVAIFEPIELEGTTVERASVHNVSIVKALELGIGDTIITYKANQIIPQISENLTRSNTCEIPVNCPTCGEKTEIKSSDNCDILVCTNDNCKAKLLGKFVHFCSRDAMNIEGLSEATLEKFIDKGYLRLLSDIYDLYQYKSEIVKTEGFGIKSYNKLIVAIEKSKNTTMDRFLYSFGINQIGRTASKNIAKYFKNNWFSFEEAILNKFDFKRLEDFGEVANQSIYSWYDRTNEIICAGYHDMSNLSIIVDIEQQYNDNATNMNKLEDFVFVITGDVAHYKNRKELQEVIESMGGRVVGSVSAKTNYLINNDTKSNSLKNKKAKELGVKIISEKDFLDLIK